MPAQKSRGWLATLMAVVGCAWFGLHALEYVAARYEPVGAVLSLPTGYGLNGLFGAIPLWADAALGATVWLGLLGALLFLLRDRAAVLVLAVALLAGVVTGVWGVLAAAGGAGKLGSVDPAQFTLAQAAVVFGLWLHARTLKRHGAL